MAGAPASDPAVFTDDRGEFTVRVPASSRLTFTKAGYVAVTVDIGKGGQAGAANPAVLVRLVRSGAVSGRVLDRSGAPVPFATVSARRVGAASTEPPFSTTGNELGEYRIGGLVEGAYVVAVGPPAFKS